MLGWHGNSVCVCVRVFVHLAEVFDHTTWKVGFMFDDNLDHLHAHLNHILQNFIVCTDN